MTSKVSLSLCSILLIHSVKDVEISLFIMRVYFKYVLCLRLKSTLVRERSSTLKYIQKLCVASVELLSTSVSTQSLSQVAIGECVSQAVV